MSATGSGASSSLGAVSRVHDPLTSVGKPTWLVVCPCGWTRECSSRWAAESVVKLHPRLSVPGTSHTLMIEEPPAEPAPGTPLPLIQRGTLGLPGGCRDARHSPEGEGPPSRGRPFGLLGSTGSPPAYSQGGARRQLWGSSFSAQRCRGC
jgi:hypothetical protein